MNSPRIHTSAPRFICSVLLSAAALLPTGLRAQYQPVIDPANIAPTITATARAAKVNVIGEPRQTKGHPCTLWDAQDIAYYKDLLQKSSTFREYFAKFRADLDKRIAEPLGVPEPKQGPDGQWMFLGDDELYKGKTGAASYFGRNGRLSRDIANLGTAYVLTGDAKYGEFAKAILLAYANNYASYGFPGGKPRYRSAVDGRLTGQFLEDGGWLIPAAFGYDLIYNLPSWKPEEREKIHKGLFNEIINQFRTERFKGVTYLNDPNNRSAIYAAATLIAGYGTEDEAMVNDGLYGTGGTKEKPTGGVFGTFFTPQCMSPDGLWTETIGYQITIAGSALINHAEVLWHHGIDLYRYNNSVLKRIFDTPIEIAYPDAEISIPEIGDTTSRLPISTGIDSVIYEYAYRRYGDPRYLPIIAKLRKSLSIGAHQPPPTLYWEPIAEAPVAREPENVNFFDLGIGILRIPASGGWNQLTLIAGPSRGHEHPDRLAVELFAQGDVVAPDPGVIYPYQDPLDAKWYQTTFAHCGLTVDEQSQISFGNLYQHRGAAVPEAKQLVYAPAATLGLQRAWTNTAYPGVEMDRAVFFTPEYMADLFGAFSQAPHQYDLVWHLRGQMTSNIPFKPHTFPEPVPNGYNGLTETYRADSTGKPWWATFSRKGKDVRLFGAGGAAAEIFTGNGHYRGELGYSAKDDFPPTVFERRAKDPATVFGSAVDVSGAPGGYIKAIGQEGSLTAGYALLNLQTVRGIDTCFAAYRPGLHKTARLETDAQQAVVTMDGANVKSMYLAGGKILNVPGGSIARGEPGLACVEKMADGAWVIRNPSPTQAEITVKLPAQGLAKTVRLAPGESTSIR